VTRRLSRHTGAGGAGLILCLSMTACAAVSDDDKALLAAPVDCANPDAQVAELEGLRPTGFRQVSTGAGLVSPEGWAGVAVHNDYQDRRKIVNGDYGRQIDARIAEIIADCRP
jgi:hypothetical protein